MDQRIQSLMFMIMSYVRKPKVSLIPNFSDYGLCIALSFLNMVTDLQYILAVPTAAHSTVLVCSAF